MPTRPQRRAHKPRHSLEIARHARSTSCAIVVATLCSSCITKNALETISDDPTVTYTTFTDRLWGYSSKENAIIEVPYSEMPESALMEDGHTYTKVDERQMYYIEGSPLAANTHTTLRVLATPAFELSVAERIRSEN